MKYSYIIVGESSAGCVLEARLSEKVKWKTRAVCAINHFKFDRPKR